MEEKKQLKISLKVAIVLVITLIVVAGIIGIIAWNVDKPEKKEKESLEKNEADIKNYEVEIEDEIIDPGFICYKPIVYLYPTEETEVSVKLMNKDKITVSYPKYEEEWKVRAMPNGKLTDLTTNKELYSLYYEAENAIAFEVENNGFVIKGENTIEFLEEKLATLGLTEREAEEFIIYWLPILENNEYNYIRFATEEEINENIPLVINPKPDTTIRVLMIYKGLDEPIEVEEQKLVTPERQGFVAVEWGGTEIR